MHRPSWLVAYTFLPGRYYVVHLEPPVWYCFVDHVPAENSCEFGAHSFQYLTKGIDWDEPIDPALIEEANYAKPAFDVFFDVLKWFEPVPLYKEQEPSPLPKLWIFGTTPETCHDQKQLFGLRVHEPPFELAVFSFDEDNCLKSWELSDEDMFVEAHQAFELWSGWNERIPDQTRRRFLP